MARQYVDRIVSGDTAAIGQVSAQYEAAEPEARTALLDLLAAEAEHSTHCLDALLRVVDDHGLDRPALRRLLVDNDQADDAHQDVLIIVAQSIGRFRGGSAFTTWLYAVARNVAVDHLRKTKATVGMDLSNREATAAAHLSSLIASRSDLANAINALPDNYQRAVILRDVEQRSYAEIATITQTEINTVKSRISRGRALVAAKMSEKMSDVALPADVRSPDGPADGGRSESSGGNNVG